MEIVSSKSHEIGPAGGVALGLAAAEDSQSKLLFNQALGRRK